MSLLIMLQDWNFLGVVIFSDKIFMAWHILGDKKQTNYPLMNGRVNYLLYRHHYFASNTTENQEI